jgi:hypothetical protein
MKRLVLSFVLLPLVSLIPSLVQGRTSGSARSQLRSEQSPQQHTNQAKEPKPDAELESIVGMAAGVPAEFGADVLIRLAESNKIRQRSLKIELLTRAFYLAESAQQPVRQASLASTRSNLFLPDAYKFGEQRIHSEGEDRRFRPGVPRAICARHSVSCPGWSACKTT